MKTSLLVALLLTGAALLPTALALEADPTPNALLDIHSPYDPTKHPCWAPTIPWGYVNCIAYNLFCLQNPQACPPEPGT